MGKNTVSEIMNILICRYPCLDKCTNGIIAAYEALVKCYGAGGKALICGNGGSAADSEHIVGELMKGFLLKRDLPEDIRKCLIETDNEKGRYMADRLQGALPAISLTSQSSLFTAFANDVDAELVFAQQVLGYGRKGDVLVGLSTSGNAKNVVNAIHVSRALGMTSIGLTGLPGGEMGKLCDIVITVPGNSTPEIQELHLPVYHTICMMVEDYFFRH